MKQLLSYSCKCKGSVVLSSIGVPVCKKCPFCTSNLVSSGDPGEPTPHNFVSYQDSNPGKAKKYRCEYCLMSREQLENLRAAL